MNFTNQIISGFDTYAGRNAFCIEDQFCTYADLRHKVSLIQQALDEQFPEEQKIGIHASDHIETYAAIIAVLLSGKTYIPIHPNHPAERTEQIIAQSGLKIVLSGTPVVYLPTAIVTDTAVICGQAAKAHLITAVTPKAGDMAYILFTSGSTGIPKGVPISYYNLDSFVDAFYKLGYAVTEQDKFLQMFDLTFDLSVMSWLIPLCLGSCVYTVSEKGMKYANIYNIVTAHRITFALMVPSVLSYLKPYFDEIDLPDLRYSLFCGEALYKETITEWAKCVPGAVIENVYGPTEATIFCMTYPITNLQEIADYHGIVSIGKPMDGMDAVVTGENNTVLADGDKGELCLHGRQLTENYLNAGKNAGPFFILDDKKYYHTGDIAYKNEDGDFMYCGRVDNQVKIQGFRVELSEIEYHLRNSPGNPNVVAIAIESFNGMNQVDIVFEGEPINTDKIINELKTKLPSYMLPSGIHFVPLFPLNTNGKTDRKALEKIINNSI